MLTLVVGVGGGKCGGGCLNDCLSDNFCVYNEAPQLSRYGCQNPEPSLSSTPPLPLSHSTTEAPLSLGDQRTLILGRRFALVALCGSSPHKSRALWRRGSQGDVYRYRLTHINPTTDSPSGATWNYLDGTKWGLKMSCFCTNYSCLLFIGYPSFLLCEHS